jgi:hypothetical protein
MFAEEGLTLFRSMGDKPGMTHMLECLTHIALSQGNQTEAEVLAKECLTTSRAIGQRWVMLRPLLMLARFALMKRVYEQAQQYLSESFALCNELSDRGRLAATLALLARLALTGKMLPLDICKPYLLMQSHSRSGETKIRHWPTSQQVFDA